MKFDIYRCLTSMSVSKIIANRWTLLSNLVAFFYDAVKNKMFYPNSSKGRSRHIFLGASWVPVYVWPHWMIITFNNEVVVDVIEVQWVAYGEWGSSFTFFHLLRSVLLTPLQTDTHHQLVAWKWQLRHTPISDLQNNVCYCFDECPHTWYGSPSKGRFLCLG